MDTNIQTVQYQLKTLRTQIAMVSLTLASMQKQMKQMEDVIAGKRLPMLKTDPNHFSVDVESVSCDEDHVLIKVDDSSESECDSDHAPLPQNTRRSKRMSIRTRYQPVPVAITTDYSSGYDS